MLQWVGAGSLGAQKRATEPNQGFGEDFSEEKPELAEWEGREAFQGSEMAKAKQDHGTVVLTLVAH